MYDVHVHMNIVVDPLPCSEILSGIYWDDLAEACGDISRAAEFWGAVIYHGSHIDSHQIPRVQPKGEDKVMLSYFIDWISVII